MGAQVRRPAAAEGSKGGRSVSASHHFVKRGASEPLHVPTKQEAREMAIVKAGLPHAILDKGDLGSMTAICRDLGDAASTDTQRDLVAELSGFLDYLRLQLA